MTRGSSIPSLLDVVCRVTGLGLAVIARISDGMWIACDVRDEIDFGLAPGDVLPVEATPCFEVEQRQRPVVIDDLAADPAHAGNPVLAGGRFRSYISAPIMMPDGRFFGTLCALGRQPATLDTPEIIGMFKLFARLIADQIDHADTLETSAASLRSTTSRLDISETGRQDAEARLTVSAADLVTANTRLAESDAALLDAAATARLREQFVAILGHDLRNPLSAIASGVRLLRRSALDERAQKILGMMEQSTTRMGELVRNMLDFAMTQLGSGISLARRDVDLRPVLDQVIGELQAGHPGRSIAAEIILADPVDCDPDRIAQLLSNLLSNALTHGASGRPVSVRAGVQGRVLELSVANTGTPIPADTMATLFKPYVRGARNNVQGLGLGLHIAASIAQAHGGTLTATSTPAETRFTLRCPG